MEYVFDGSDDDLEMGEMEVGDSDYLDRDTKGTEFLNRQGDGDDMEESDGGDEDSESMGDDGEGKSTDDESGDGMGSRRGRRGGVASQCGVVRKDRSRSRAARGQGGCGRRGTGRGRLPQERPWTSVASPVDIAPFTQAVGANFTVPDDFAGIFRVLFTPGLLQHIADETNRFASQCLSAAQEGGESPWETTPRPSLASLSSWGS